MTQTKRRPNLDTVDVELTVNKENKKLFKKAAYSMGMGIAMVLILPLLAGFVGDEVKSAALARVFTIFGFSMMAYAVAIGFSFFFLRQNIKLVMFMLSWFFLPSVAIWAIMEASDILGGK